MFIFWPAATGGEPDAPIVTVDFDQWITWPEREEIILAELSPRYELTSFAATLGLLSTYSHDMPRFVGQQHVPGGVYRRVVGVRQNDIELSLVSSSVEVNDNAGSWYWDEATGILYASLDPASAGGPQGFGIVTALVTFYVGNVGVVLNEFDENFDSGRYYQPWIVGDLPTLVEEVEDVLTGAKAMPQGGIVMTNGHGFWHEIVATDGLYTWKNKRVRILTGGRWLNNYVPYEQYQPLATMLVDDVASDEVTCQFMLRPMARLMDIELPVTPYFETSYPLLGEGVRGTKKSLVYGRVWMVPDLTSVDPGGVTGGTYTVADAAFQTLYAVNQVVATGGDQRFNLTEGQDYTVNLIACTITIINPLFTHETFTITAEVTGKAGGVRGYLSTFGEIARDMLQTFAAIPDDQFDEASWERVKLQAPQELGVWIKETRSMSSIVGTSEPGLPSLERSVHGTVYQTRAGLWAARIWKPSYDANGMVRLRKEDLAEFLPQPKLEVVFTTTRVNYAQVASGAWSVADFTDDRLRMLTDSRDRFELYTYLRNAGDAEVLARRYQAVTGAATLEVDFAERGVLMAKASAGDRILVTFSPAPVSGGACIDRPFEVVRFERAVSPRLTLRGRLADLHGIKNDVGRWMVDDAPPIDTADQTDIDTGAYWSDAFGSIGHPDGFYANRYKWW